MLLEPRESSPVPRLNLIDNPDLWKYPKNLEITQCYHVIGVSDGFFSLFFFFFIDNIFIIEIVFKNNVTIIKTRIKVTFP